MQRQKQMLEQQGKIATSQDQHQSANMLQQQQQQQQQQPQRQPVRANPTFKQYYLQQSQHPKQGKPEATFQYHRQIEIVNLTTYSPPQTAPVRASGAPIHPKASLPHPSEAPLRPWVARQVPDGSWAVPSMGFYALAVHYPPLHTLYNSTLYNSPYANTTQQFTPQLCSRSHNSVPANIQLTSQAPPKHKSPQKPVPTTSNSRAEPPQNRYDPTEFNERKEQARLKQERLREVAYYAGREYIIASDPHMNYRNYLESLDYFPVPRGERTNPYLAGLIANQILPVDPNSDRAIAIRFAKKHWDKYWEMQDIDLVLEWAKKAQNKDSGAERDDT